MLARTYCRPASFNSFAREMDRVFEAMRGRTSTPGSASATHLPVNLWQTEDAFVAELELPGFTMNDIAIDATEQAFTVKGSRSIARPETAKVLRAERGAVNFERTIRLPSPINVEAVIAKLTDGVLTITLPLAESRKPRRVEVK